MVGNAGGYWQAVPNVRVCKRSFAVDDYGRVRTTASLQLEATAPKSVRAWNHPTKLPLAGRGHYQFAAVESRQCRQHD
jgi:hypothetical protein